MTIADAEQRVAAIDPSGSFCVSAPAGSGKTEILIQRYLRLLSRVERPEQVLAITFTRKAAAEMRERVVEALQGALRSESGGSAHQRTTRALAEQALAADERGEWHLLRDISRLNIRTIDSFCGALTRQMPVLSEFGGQARPVDDAGELYAEAVLELFHELDSDHPVAADLAALMLHFDNDWARLQSLLVAMLACRDQWRSYVGIHQSPEESEAYLLATVRSLVRSELTALAPCLAPYAGILLDLQHYAAGNQSSDPLGHYPGTEPAELDAWRVLSNMLQTRTGGWRKRIDKSFGFPPGKGEAQARKDQLKALLAELEEIDGLAARLFAVRGLPETASGSDTWQLLVHLSRLLPLLAAQLLLVFQKRGAVDHAQIVLSALQALGEDDAPTELALRLDYRIEHILVDEFQDTAINQYELLRCLTRGWGQHNATNPQSPRTVMIVGDGMQSIYGFRGANVGLFLKARREGFNGVIPTHLALRCNFRSDEGVVDWVNKTFARAFPAVEDINRGQVSFSPAVPVRPAALQPAVLMHSFHGEAAQAQEVDFVCRHIADAHDDSSCDNIAVLGRTRGHLQPVIRGLKQLGIPYSARDLDSLAESTVVADLVTLCRALANGADRLAWLALLRAPWCGLQMGDLLAIANWGECPAYTPVWSTLCDERLGQSLSAAGRLGLDTIRPVLQRAQQTRDRLGLRVWIEQAWLGLGGPACAAQSTDLEDAEMFFQLLEQAEREGVGLDTRWLDTRLEKHYLGGGDPASKVQLMTLHKAKGLEFDRVILPQLAKSPRSDSRQLLLWDEHSSPDGKRSFLLATDDHSAPGAPTLYNYLHQQGQEKSLLEGTRLLYVGATRAVGQLLLTASLRRDERSGEFKPPPARSLLSPIWPAFREQMTVHDPQLVPPVGDTVIAAGKLARLKRSAMPIEFPAESPPTRAAGSNIPARPDNHIQRIVGTVVHLALEELSSRDDLPAAIKAADRARWRLALQEEGLWGAPLEEALLTVADSLTCSLQPGGEGRWVLSKEHLQARSEWALTTMGPEGERRDLVIDRTFVDAVTGERWLIDYKNSRPQEGESLAAFTARESALYRPQLQRYRDALRALGDEPVRCALFFTALGHLHLDTELDQAAAGT